MWEVDPETKSKLLALQKRPSNGLCVDCGAPAPQWASPKFGTFICLDCAGIHRGLGVHISFVRSIMMDSFKVSEVRRMEEGGNEAWRAFWDAHEEGGNGDAGAWEKVGVAGRYTGNVGEEWKERLAAKAEGREYVPIKREKKVLPPAGMDASGPASRSVTPANGRATPLGARGTPGRSESPATTSRKAKNETYFAKMGAENANRRDDLAPSQGGKYAGFGSSGPEAPKKDESAMPGVDDFQKDPVAALTKGFGWFTTAVSKQAKTVNDSYIQPGIRQLAETDALAQARITAASVGAAVASNVQKGTKGAAEQLSRFVEGADDRPRSIVQPDKKDFWDSFGGAAKLAEPEKKDFWDDFGAGPGSGGGPALKTGAGAKKPSAVGTAAMKGSGSASVEGGEWKDEEW